MYPFTYDAALKKDLAPFLEPCAAGPRFSAWLRRVRRGTRLPTRSEPATFWWPLNQRVHKDVQYLIRLVDRECETELDIELLRPDTQLYFFLMAGVGNDCHSDDGHQNACHREQAAARIEQHRCLSMHERRDQRADNQRDADSHADAERHSEMTHGEPIADVAHSPHGAEERDLDHEGGIKRRVKAMEAWQQKKTHSDWQENPGEESRDGPGRFPRPFPHLFNRCIERSSAGRSDDVPSDSRQDYCRHSVSVFCVLRRTRVPAS